MKNTCVFSWYCERSTFLLYHYSLHLQRSVNRFGTRMCRYSKWHLNNSIGSRHDGRFSIFHSSSSSFRFWFVFVFCFFCFLLFYFKLELYKEFPLCYIILTKSCEPPIKITMIAVRVFFYFHWQGVTVSQFAFTGSCQFDFLRNGIGAYGTLNCCSIMSFICNATKLNNFIYRSQTIFFFYYLFQFYSKWKLQMEN